MSDEKPIGILITLTDPTKEMITQAAAVGSYESSQRKYPRVQILTVRDIIQGKRPHIPPKGGHRPFAKAPLERKAAKTERML